MISLEFLEKQEFKNQIDNKLLYMEFDFKIYDFIVSRLNSGKEVSVSDVIEEFNLHEICGTLENARRDLRYYKLLMTEIKYITNNEHAKTLLTTSRKGFEITTPYKEYQNEIAKLMRAKAKARMYSKMAQQEKNIAM
jgi:hypothetical protein